MRDQSLLEARDTVTTLQESNDHLSVEVSRLSGLEVEFCDVKRARTKHCLCFVHEDFMTVTEQLSTSEELEAKITTPQQLCRNPTPEDLYKSPICK